MRQVKAAPVPDIMVFTIALDTAFPISGDVILPVEPKTPFVLQNQGFLITSIEC